MMSVRRCNGERKGRNITEVFGLVLGLALSLLVVLSFIFGRPLAPTASFLLKSVSLFL